MPRIYTCPYCYQTATEPWLIEHEAGCPAGEDMSSDEEGNEEEEEEEH